MDKYFIIRCADVSSISNDPTLRRAYIVRHNGLSVGVGVYYIPAHDGMQPYWAVMPVWDSTQGCPFYGYMPYWAVIGALRYVQNALDQALYKRHGILHRTVRMWN